MKKVVGVISGGRSAEHEVSVVSGRAVCENMDKEKFLVKEIFIDKKGRWFVESKEASVEKALEGVDIAFPVLHGTFGEDGKIQGLFEMLDLPFVGCGVAESVLGMDKEFSKIIWKQHSLPVVNFVSIQKNEWESDWEDIKQTQLDLAKNLRLPVFVKPANLGSSIGISKVKGKDDIERAIDFAFQFGGKVLVEEAVDEAREIEVSVLGNNSTKVSICGEIIPSKEFYDYEAKYKDETSILKIPAPIDEGLEKRIQETAVNAFKQLGLYGLARIDFLLVGKTNRFYINEVNTMPGFTPISMYPKLWQASGIAFKDLLSRLVELGFEKYNEKSEYRVDYGNH